MFGTALGLAQRIIHNIEEQGSHRNLSLCFKRALELWLSMEIEHTWQRVCEAVEDSDNKTLANKLRERHKNHLEGDCYR